MNQVCAQVHTCVSRCVTVGLKLRPSCEHGGVGGRGCVCAQLCVRVHGGGKALSAAPSLQHSLSFTPGRLLRNVSGREAKNIHSPPLLTAWAAGAVGPGRPLGPWGEQKLLDEGRGLG